MLAKTKAMIDREGVIQRQAAAHYRRALRDYTKSRRIPATRVEQIKKSIAAKDNQADELNEEIRYIEGLIEEEKKELYALATTVKRADEAFYKDYLILAQQAGITEPQQFTIEV